MSEIRKLENNFIGYPCTPCKWTSEIRYKKISKLLITYGGGMGGSKRIEYVERVKNINNDSIQSFVRFDGKTIKYNTRYIVSIEDFTMVSIDYETTNQYHKPKGTLNFLVEDDVQVKTINEYHRNLKG